MVVRKMIRIARTYRITSIASGYAVLTSPLGAVAPQPSRWWLDDTLYVALALARFTMVCGVFVYELGDGRDEGRWRHHWA